MRRPIIAGNWKMYKTIEQTCEFFEQFLPMVASCCHCDIVICPSFVNLRTAVEAVRNTPIAIGGQNLFWAQEGAFTGEVSAGMLKAVGCRSVLIAHSERRQYFGETDETACKKIGAAIEADLMPIICIGEMLEQREAGQTNIVLANQIRCGIAPLGPDQFSRIAIAYEPVWAIGTGKTATPDIAAETHGMIRKEIESHYGAVAASDCRILYGGSVKPDNIEALMAEEEIDGVLVGGASLDARSFAAIVNY